MKKRETMAHNEVITYIEQAYDFEIQEIMNAVERWYAIAYLQWDVFYVAVHKDPELRKKELEELSAYIAKDIQWYEENKRKDSLK